MRVTDTSDLWWKSAVVYCLDIETFYDSDGDGVGDLAGLAQRIDYLAELAAVGFDDLYLHHVGQDQTAFIDTFAAEVLPALRG